MDNEKEYSSPIVNAIKFFEAVDKARREREAEQRAIDSEERAIKREEEERQSRIRHEKANLKYMQKPTASDKLGAGRLGTLKDAQKENMLDANGLFLGVLEGQPIFYNGDAHLLNYALTRSGKGRDIILPNLAHVFNRSLVVNDIKDGENAYASAHHRAKKHRIITINPYNLHGFKNFKLNPFQRIINKANIGKSVSEDCLQLCMSIIPPLKDKNEWVAKGAQQILATWLEWAAIFRPDRCNLSTMYIFVFSDFENTLIAIKKSGHLGLEIQADLIYSFYQSEDQWNAYQSELSTGLWNFRPDTPLAKVTETSNFSPENMRYEKTTLYLMGNSDLLEASAKWIALTITSIVNSAAQTPGKIPMTFIIDELANLPYMSIIPKALTLYAGKGVQLWGLCQGRQALLDKGYNEHTIKNFESQSGILHMWNVKETDLIKDIETWSGNTAVATRGINVSGGAVSSTSSGISEHKRSVLQSEDIMKIGNGLQIIRTNGPHLYIAKRMPWYKVFEWKDKLKDVRKIHFENAVNDNQRVLPVTYKLPAPRKK